MRIVFALTGTVLVALLLVAALRDTHPEWREFQLEYKRVSSERASDPRIREVILEEPVAIKQIILSDLNRIDRCTSCHAGMENPVMKGYAQPLGTHPGDMLEHHPPERYGCTICHQGQGLATTEEDAHARDYPGWESPLLTRSSLGSSCVRCHQRSLPEGAGLAVRGRELFRSFGCKGCHQVNRRGGILGPSLTNLGEQPIHVKHPSEHGIEKYLSRALGDYNLGFIFESIQNPRADSPNSAMPAYGFNTADVDALGVFVKGLRSRTMPEAYVASRTDGELNGEVLFGEFCSACHGQKGEGGLQVGRMGTSLNNQDFLAVASRQFIREVITNGRTGFNKAMPSWKRGVGGLTTDEIEMLTEHILSFKAPPPSFEEVMLAPGTVEDGSSLYEEHCSTCHAADLAGGIGPSLKTTSFLQLASSRFLYEALAHGRPGTAMVSWQMFDAGTIKSLILYLESQLPAKATAEQVVAIRGDAAAGARRYRRRCRSCHGSEGSGDTAPPLNRPELLATGTDIYLARVMVEGRKEAGMPSWRHLEVEELANILAYVRSLAQPEPYRARVGKGDVLNGRKLFEKSCRSCHGSAEIGAAAPAIGNPEFLMQADDAYIKSRMAYGRYRTAIGDGVRPTHRGLGLKESEMDDVTAYLRSFAERTASPTRMAPGSAEAGKEPFARVCAECHGTSGRGGSGPALANPLFLRAASDGYIAANAVMGRAGTAMFAMVSPVSGPKSVTPEELVDVIAYLRKESRSYWEGTPSSYRTLKGDLARGAATYKDICARCHGETGRGTKKAPALNDPVFLSNVSDGYLAATVVLGRRATIMHRSTEPGSILTRLKSEDVPNLVEYLRSLQGPGQVEAQIGTKP